jgi:4-carboxymuconolactone decarboxylase
MKQWMVLVSGVTFISAVLVFAIPIAKVYSSGQEPRFPPLKVEQLNDQQRVLAEKILRISSVGINGPYNPMLRSPEMGERMFQLLDYVRFSTSVPHRLNEFAILIQSRLWTSQIEWYAHYPLAIKAGLSEAVADDLKAGRRPTSMQPDEAIVYDLCTELSIQHEVSDATFQRARAIFSEEQVVDLIVTSGTYVTIAMLTNAAEEGVPSGQTSPLHPLPAH